MQHERKLSLFEFREYCGKLKGSYLYILDVVNQRNYEEIKSKFLSYLLRFENMHINLCPNEIVLITPDKRFMHPSQVTISNIKHIKMKEFTGGYSLSVTCGWAQDSDESEYNISMVKM